MTQEKLGPSRSTWAYAYELVPPQSAERLASLKALLEVEASNAKLRSETWEARMIRESSVSHILIVSDTPDQGREVNRRIEAALAALEAGFAITHPMEVADGDGRPDQTLPDLTPTVPEK